VQEVLYNVDPGLRAAVVQALILTLREAQRDERRICATIALDAALSATPADAQGLGDRIAAAILMRDDADEQSRGVGEAV
jgi:hypothetical protein